MATIEKRQGLNGKQSYRVRIRLKGFPTQSASFDRITDAKRWVQETEPKIREGRYFSTVEAKKHTLAELVDRYIKQVLPNKPKTKRSQNAQLLWWKERLGSYVLADVSPALITEHREILATEETVKPNQNNPTKRRPATVNRYLAALSHAFTVAINEWQWVDVNPLRKVKKFKEPRGRVRYLSDDERDRLLEACKASHNTMLYPIVVLALSTGARKSEILNIRWDDVDFSRERIIIHQTKNDERRALPLTGHALKLLKQHSKVRNIASGLVFPSNDSGRPIDIRAPWEEALGKAMLIDFRFHDLRHSAASYLAMNGSSLAVIAETLGHKTLSMVKRYAHLSESHISGEVERMNKQIFG